MALWIGNIATTMSYAISWHLMLGVVNKKLYYRSTKKIIRSFR